MKKIFSFLCLIAAIVVAMSACSSTKEEKGTSETGNAALDNIFARKSVRTYLNKGVEKEKIDLMLRAGMAAPFGERCPSLGIYSSIRSCQTGFNGCAFVTSRNAQRR